MDEEQRIKFRFSLENPTPKRHLKIVPTTTEKVKYTPKQRWRAPEGWKPPGWNEERSYQNAKAFMGFQANPK